MENVEKQYRLKLALPNKKIGDILVRTGKNKFHWKDKPSEEFPASMFNEEWFEVYHAPKFNVGETVFVLASKAKLQKSDPLRVFYIKDVKYVRGEYKYNVLSANSNLLFDPRSNDYVDEHLIVRYEDYWFVTIDGDVKHSYNPIIDNLDKPHSGDRISEAQTTLLKKLAKRAEWLKHVDNYFNFENVAREYVSDVHETIRQSKLK